MQRRQFIQSIAGAMALSLGGVTAYQYYQQQQLDYSTLNNKSFLTIDDQLVLSALIPVFASNINNMPALSNVMDNIDEAIVRLPLKTQQELRQLLDLLASSFGRLVLAGVWRNWQMSESADIDEFLTEWRQHRLSLLQQAYIGLHQLILGAVYAEETTWLEIGYPGPPKFSN